MFLGCSHTAGRKYDTTAVDRIKVGQTTESEVITMLGRPLTEEKFSNAIKFYNYAYGDRCPIGLGTSMDKMHVQLYNGVVINTWQVFREE
jgi:outer membrane protein assembly factor BamE (lipoprotein component of BamABCDE complex)